jgi:hypothetical protein
MTRGKAVIAAVVVAVAMALAGAGISHTGQTKVHVVATDMRGSDNEQAGREMSS